MKISPEDSVAEHFRLTDIQKTALKKLGLHTIHDLLYHFPVRYGDTAEARNIDSLRKGDAVVIFGKIGALEASKGFKSKVTMATGTVEDDTGKIQCVWFNQPYLAKMYTDGMLVRIEGKVSERRRPASNNPQPATLYFSNPKMEKVAQLPVGAGDSLFGADGEAHTLYPVYPESRGISSLWLYHALERIFKSGLLDNMPEPIPADILSKYNLPGIKTALIWIHTPLKRDDAVSARKRFSFEQIFTIQLGKQQARKEYESSPAYEIEHNPKLVQEFIRRFPFQATLAQKRSIDTVLADMQSGHAMARLLEGDVGSGKTAVAAVTAHAVVTSHPPEQNYGSLQVAYMCPTEILAIQHFESFIQYFAYLGVQIALITSSGCRKFPSKVNPKGWTDISRAQLLAWVANGEIAVVIGTHALIQKSVQFKHLAYVIIDEQHRFGTSQRAALVKKNSGQGHLQASRNTHFPSPQITEPNGSGTAHSRRREDPVNIPQYGVAAAPKGSSKLANAPAPHLLSMTATPIPRTLALTLYGDLDLSLLDESPAGRKPIVTEIVTPGGREEVYEKVRQELRAGRQMYVICPRIDEPDPDKELVLNAKSVKEEAKRLKEKIFPEYEIGILHSRMRPKEKDEVMLAFKSGQINILCATSVVEVGVNVPNATVIIIEGAERFGLAQLHQLRGRVLRSSHQAYCYAFTETTSQKSIERLNALSRAKNGFELAELDLAQRGSGQLSGLRQWGVSDIAMEALKNLKMVEAARTEARRLVDEDSTLAQFPLLQREVEASKRHSHFE